MSDLTCSLFVVSIVYSGVVLQLGFLCAQFPGLLTMHCQGVGLGFRLESKDQRRSNALLSLCWQSWTSSSFYAQPPFHHRVPLYRMRRPIEALKERGFTRQALEWKYGSMTPRSFKDAPEPLTNYLDVSEKGLVRNPPTSPPTQLCLQLSSCCW